MAPVSRIISAVFFTFPIRLERIEMVSITIVYHCRNRKTDRRGNAIIAVNGGFSIVFTFFAIFDIFSNHASQNVLKRTRSNEKLKEK